MEADIYYSHKDSFLPTKFKEIKHLQIVHHAAIVQNFSPLAGSAFKCKGFFSQLKFHLIMNEKNQICSSRQV